MGGGEVAEGWTDIVGLEEGWADIVRLEAGGALGDWWGS